MEIGCQGVCKRKKKRLGTTALRCVPMVYCNWVRTDSSQIPSDLFVTIFTGLCVDKQPNSNSFPTVMLLLLTFLPNPLFYVLRRLRRNNFVTHYYRHSILVPQNKNVKEVHEREMIVSFASWNGEAVI